ncbi:phage head morphogenesis protein [Ornithobacterium rhinotracheale]|nr:phage head morphogenesis protein [Ornithobacterium rhinotracheale]
MSRLIEDYIREVFEERKVSEAQREALWEYYYQQLSSAVDLGYSPALEHYSEELALSLKQNIAEFSAFKETSFRKQLEASLTENGRVLSWKEFKQKAEALNIEYNHRWLKTEYDQTIATATQAGKYQEYLENKHLYPNLKYKTIGDHRVREKHKQWDELILPVGHPFWKTHLPPNDWGCRCYVVPTDEEPNREIQKGEPLKETFANNPAVSGKIFPTSGYLTLGGLNPETIEKIIDWSHEMFKRAVSQAKQLVKNKKKLPIFKGKIDDFVKKTLADKRTKNEVFHLANMNTEVLKDMANIGIKKGDKKIMLMDKTITKYINHPKKEKNATLDFEKFSEIQKALKTPTHIYRQEYKSRTLYIYEYQYNNGKSLKVVVEPNFIINKKYPSINCAKSIGVVDTVNMTRNSKLSKIK